MPRRGPHNSAGCLTEPAPLRRVQVAARSMVEDAAKRCQASNLRTLLAAMPPTTDHARGPRFEPLCTPCASLPTRRLPPPLPPPRRLAPQLNPRPAAFPAPTSLAARAWSRREAAAAPQPVVVLPQHGSGQSPHGRAVLRFSAVLARRRTRPTVNIAGDTSPAGAPTDSAPRTSSSRYVSPTCPRTDRK